MPLSDKLQQQLNQLLQVVDDIRTTGPRLIDDAQRLTQRVRKLANMKLVTGDIDLDLLEIACYAMQLPMRHGKSLPAGKLGKTSLRDRAEQAAELLVSTLGDEIDEPMLDRVTRLLQELPQRAPKLNESRILADAVNLDDFGVSGLVRQSMQLARHGAGILQLVEAFEKREEYGYWQARLKDGFHFEPVRKMARKRLDHAMEALKLLAQEMKDDRA